MSMHVSISYYIGHIHGRGELLIFWLASRPHGMLKQLAEYFSGYSGGSNSCQKRPIFSVDTCFKKEFIMIKAFLISYVGLSLLS